MALSGSANKDGQVLVVGRSFWRLTDNREAPLLFHSLKHVYIASNARHGFELSGPRHFRIVGVADRQLIALERVDPLQSSIAQMIRRKVNPLRSLGCVEFKSVLGCSSVWPEPFVVADRVSEVTSKGRTPGRATSDRNRPFYSRMLKRMNADNTWPDFLVAGRSGLVSRLHRFDDRARLFSDATIWALGKLCAR